MTLEYKIWDFPVVPIEKQLFHVPGAVFEGGFTSGGARIQSAEPGGRSVLEVQVAFQVAEWDFPFSSWIMSKMNGQIFRVPLTKTPQLISNTALNGGVDTPGNLGIPWAAWNEPDYGVGEIVASGEFTTGLPDGVTLERSSVGTYFDADGVLQTAAIDGARIDHDPITGDVLGVLIEDAATNIFSWSEDFSNAIWGPSTATRDKNYLAPNGQLDATLFTIVDVNSCQIRQIGITLPTVSSFSIFVKAGTSHTLTMRYVSFDTSVIVRFDLSTQIVTLIGGVVVGTIEDVGDGFFRCSITPTLIGSDLTGDVYAYLATDTGTNFGAAVGNSMYVWGAQLETGSALTSYIKTMAAPVARAADVLTIPNALGENQFQITYDDASEQVFPYAASLELNFGNIARKYVQSYELIRAANGITTLPSPWDNDQYWSDDGVAVDATAVALEGTSAVLIDMSALGPILKHGHVFGIGDTSYIVDDIEYDDENIATVTVVPPLRTAVAVGDLIFFRPYFLGTISNGNEVLNTYDAENIGSIQIGRIMFDEVII